MKVKKAIEILKTLVPKTCKMVDGRLKGGFDNWESDKGKSITMAIKCMEEVEQYRALGTVEEIKKKIQTELPYMSLAQARFKSELDEYRNIGTVEELKEAREKQIPKKPLKVKGDCYSRDKEGNEGYVVLYLCPRCKSQVLVNPLPCECGQKIDWENIWKLDWSEEDD